jgi:hypothetical protein
MSPRYRSKNEADALALAAAQNEKAIELRKKIDKQIRGLDLLSRALPLLIDHARDSMMVVELYKGRGAHELAGTIGAWVVFERYFYGDDTYSSRSTPDVFALTHSGHLIHGGYSHRFDTEVITSDYSQRSKGLSLDEAFEEVDKNPNGSFLPKIKNQYALGWVLGNHDEAMTKVNEYLRPSGNLVV